MLPGWATLDRKVFAEALTVALGFEAVILLVAGPIELLRVVEEVGWPASARLAGPWGAAVIGRVLVETLALSILLAVAAVCGRQIRDGEIRVADACGISPARRAVPFLALGAGAAALSFGLYGWGVPTLEARALAAAWRALPAAIERAPAEPTLVALAGEDARQWRILVGGEPERTVHLWRAHDDGWPREVWALRRPTLRDHVLEGSGVYVRFGREFPAAPPEVDSVLTFGRARWPLPGAGQVREPLPRALVWADLARAAADLPAGPERVRFRRHLNTRAAAGFSPALLALVAWWLLERLRPRWGWQAFGWCLGYWLLVHYPVQLAGQSRALNAIAGGYAPWLPWVAALGVCAGLGLATGGRAPARSGPR